MQTVAHAKYDSILNRYVDGGYFDYKSFPGDQDTVKSLEESLQSMARVAPVQLSQDEQLAYWMNLYNASTIHFIEDDYPVESIKDLGGWLSLPFEKEFIETKRGTLSLDTVELEIIRSRFDEPMFILPWSARHEAVSLYGTQRT